MMAPTRQLNVRELLELERQIYQESIDRVLQQQETLHRGELEDFLRRCRPFEADRDQELAAAKAQLELSKRDALSLFEFDLQQAQDIFQAERQKLKLKLLKSSRKRLFRLEKRLEALNSEHVPVKKLKTSIKGLEGDLNFGEKLEPKTLEKQLTKAQRCTRKSFNFRHLQNGVLPNPHQIVKDVMQECETLQRNRETEEMAKMAKEEGVALMVEVVVSQDGQKLIYRGDSELSFGVGDPVVLMSKLSEEEFHGFVAGITTEEVQLVLVCGSHVRVTLARLRSGQCSLRPQTDQVVQNKPREDGQEGYRSGLDLFPVECSLQGLTQDPPDARRRAVAAMNRRKRKTTIDIRRGF
ncbi:hypothetical protein PHYBOEH_004457 [Phytophthora boehmeriae]|uniref:Uncharacterized protein n=1 Tax=Phytophthora boehmeriae TaxID=109152 RepID=A0A8T1WNF4_9STRA|nr:hypothetical protein PHYBOEH_004457 [Phytophthora boehmeriae]